VDHAAPTGRKVTAAHTTAALPCKQELQLKSIALVPLAGNDPTPLEQVSIESWADFVADLVGTQPEPVILVGHSRAGIVISRAAELVPANLLGLVYLAAFMVRDGQTLESVMRQIPPRAESANSLEMSEDLRFSTIAPDALERVFYNSSPPQLVARARTLSGPEPMASFTTPLRVTKEGWGSVRRFYIECSKDRAIAPDLQRLMQAALPCHRTISMSTDHSPFYSAPVELAGHLHSVAEELAPQIVGVRNGRITDAMRPTD
jgi:pimeloyl-ACP methyl ester carboxylesterase